MRSLFLESFGKCFVCGKPLIKPICCGYGQRGGPVKRSDYPRLYKALQAPKPLPEGFRPEFVTLPRPTNDR
jgi:hypothetical protein